MSESNLCFSCHNGTGATTDVTNGLQYVPAGLAGGHAAGNPVLGALRGGGFQYALIDPTSGHRKTYLSQTQAIDLSDLNIGDDFTISGNFASTPFTTGPINYFGPGNGSTTLTAALTASATTMSVSSPSGFPAAGAYTILIDSEQIQVESGQATQTWTITRAVNGTTAAAHNNGATVYRWDQVEINPFLESTPKNYTQAGATAKAIANALLGTQAAPAYGFSYTAGIVPVTGADATKAKQPNFSVSYSDPLAFGDGTFRVSLQNDLTFVTAAWELMWAHAGQFTDRQFTFPSEPALRQLVRVGVLASANKQPVTSSHLNGPAVVWGNGDVAAGAGITLGAERELSCVSCHNPHGNGAYRILRADPGEEWIDELAPDFENGADVIVPDISSVDPRTTVRNYTVLPADAALSTATVTGANAYINTQGDYMRRKYKAWNFTNFSADFDVNGWNPTRPARVDTDLTTVAGPNVTTWCIACHTRYNGIPTVDYETGASEPSSLVSPSNGEDLHFTYRHGTANAGCLMCHVSHGSNPQMTGSWFLGVPNPADNSQFVYRLAGADLVFQRTDAVQFTVPAGTEGTDYRVEGDSRLLKVDNMGTCTLCHDPTETILGGQTVGPAPSPIAP